MTPIGIITLVTAIIGAICGICGAVLGIINTWSLISRNRVRLKVIPKIAFMVGGDNVIAGIKRSELQKQLMSQGTPWRWGIEAINLSAFAVTISAIGFGKANKTRHVIIKPEVSVGKSWPARLEPREAVTLYAGIGETLNPIIMQEEVAYVKTDCGVICYGTSPIFSEYCKWIRSEQNKDGQ